MKRQIRIVLTGGGTGGHVFPLLAVAEELWNFARNVKLNFRLYYVGPLEGPFATEPQLFLEKGIIVKPIRAGSFSRSGIRGGFDLVVGVLQAFLHLFFVMPDVIFSKGGYGALPVVFSRKIYRIPLFIHESDAIPGKVNLMSRKAAVRIAVSFRKSLEYFPKEKTALVGNPVRRELLERGEKAAALGFFGFDTSRKTLLILGGSQGAKALNDIVLDILPQLLERYHVIHQCGPRNFKEVRQEAGFVLRNAGKEDLEGFYKLYGFLDSKDVASAYTAADLVVSRAGAGQIFELAALGKPSILVPLGSASKDHQRENAYEYEESGGAVVLEETNLTQNLFFGEIEKLLKDEAKLKSMREAGKTFAKPDAARILAKELLLLCGVKT